MPNVTPHNKFHPNRMKNAEIPILEIFDPQIFFERSAKAKPSKLERFAWSHWIQNYEKYSGVSFIRGLILGRKCLNFSKCSQGKK